MVQYVQKNYEAGVDLSKSLKKMQYIDLTVDEPKRELSKQTDPKLRPEDQKGLDIKYGELFRSYNERVQQFEKSKPKCFALIMSNYCTNTMRQRVEEHPDFETKIDDDPIALLEAIKV